MKFLRLYLRSPISDYEKHFDVIHSASLIHFIRLASYMLCIEAPDLGLFIFNCWLDIWWPNIVIIYRKSFSPGALYRGLCIKGARNCVFKHTSHNWNCIIVVKLQKKTAPVRDCFWFTIIVNN